MRSDSRCETNVNSQCVLANGDIVSATPENDFSDLFWALRGGGNSFAILTAVHLKTISLPAVAVGETTYNGSVADALLDSIYDFALYGSEDVKAGIEPRVQWIPEQGSPTYHGILFYNGDDASPPALVNFTDKDSLQSVSSTFRVRDSMFNWTQEADSGREQLRGLRARFNVVTIRANRQALGIIHDTFLGMMADELEGVASIVGSLAFVPITAEYLKVSTINGGDPMAVDASQAPYILAEQTFLWSNSSDDAKISGFLDAFNANVTTQLNSLDGVQSSYLYLNYADEGQAVFEGYPAENVARMKDIRDKYDPDMVFTDLMVGGWKVGEV